MSASHAWSHELLSDGVQRLLLGLHHELGTECAAADVEDRIHLRRHTNPPLTAALYSIIYALKTLHLRRHTNYRLPPALECSMHALKTTDIFAGTLTPPGLQHLCSDDHMRLCMHHDAMLTVPWLQPALDCSTHVLKFAQTCRCMMTLPRQNLSGLDGI